MTLVRHKMLLSDVPPLLMMNCLLQNGQDMVKKCHKWNNFKHVVCFRPMKNYAEELNAFNVGQAKRDADLLAV